MTAPTPPRTTLRTARRAVALAVGAALLAAAAACDLAPSNPAPSASASAARPLLISAPDDCLTNAYCGRGLASVYGVDVADHLVASDRVADSVAALERGEVDVAVVFSHSPAASDPDLVVLRDDQGMLASERVTPVFRRSLTALHGAAFEQALDDLSALVTEEALTELDAAVGAGTSPQQAAAAWLDRAAPTASPSATAAPAGGTRPIVVGSADFLESRVLGQVIAQFLERRGYPTTPAELAGGRALVVDALANGDIDVAAEYSASLLEYLNGRRGEAGADADATSARLDEYLDLIGARSAGPAPATSTNVFVTTKEVSQQRGLTSLSGLAAAGVPATTPGTPPDAVDATADPELAVHVRAVGHQLAAGSTGPEVRDVQERLEALGFETPVDGTYDSTTVAAVRSFQASQGLASDGVAGPATQKALASPKAAVDEPEPVNPGDAEVAAPPKAARGGGGGKVIYLTFDDGPGVTYTKQILDLLDRHDAKATFFELGENATAHPDLTRAVVERGHALANHTWDHADMRRLSGSALRHEISATTERLEKISGRKVTCLRPPYGALNREVRAAVKDAGLSLQLWDIDPQDWNRPGTDAIVRNVVRNARPGAVSLMHDGGGNRTQTVAALKQVLEQLGAQGYRFESLPGC